MSKLLFACGMLATLIGNAQTLPSKYSAFRVTLKDSSQKRVIRQFIQEVKVYRPLSPDKNVIWIRVSDRGMSESYEWLVTATGREDFFRKQVPNYILLVDGYRVAFVFGSYRKDLLKYSKEYLAYLEEDVISRLEKTPPFETRQMVAPAGNGKRRTVTVTADPRPMEGYGHWSVVFQDGKEPVINR